MQVTIPSAACFLLQSLLGRGSPEYFFLVQCYNDINISRVAQIMRGWQVFSLNCKFGERNSSAIAAIGEAVLLMLTKNFLHQIVVFIANVCAIKMLSLHIRTCIKCYAYKY